MAEENATSNADSTPEQTAVETQEVAPQADIQADTTPQDDQVTQSMAIEEAAPVETVEESQPTIDDIVAEALSGELTEETQKLIDDNGLGKHIDMLVAGHTAIQEKNNQEIFSVVGGQESYSELQEWGKSNMSKDEQEAFNEALFSGNLNLAKLAVQGLNAQYVAKNGRSPDKVIEGGGSANADNRPFSSQMEYIKATQSLEYKQNPEVRRSVEAKRNASGF